MNDYEFTKQALADLNETNQHAGASIFAHVLLYGRDDVAALVAAAKQHPGMSRRDGTPRTLGGVYFQLAKGKGWETDQRRLRKKLTSIVA